MPLLLTEADVARCLEWADLIPLMRDTLARFSRGDCDQPVRSSLHVRPADGYYGVMPAHIRADDGPGALGIKSVAFYPGNDARGLSTHLATILSLDAATGALDAILDGRLITEMRTAAVSAVSVDLLARRGDVTLAILGSGVQARAHLDAVAQVRTLTHVRVWSRRPDRALKFVHTNVRSVPCPISAVSSVADAVRGADVIVTATSATEPVLTADALAPGMHLAVVGSSHPRMREVDTATLSRCRVFVDSRAAAAVEAGDLLIPEREGAWSLARIVAELGEVAAGTPGRTSDTDITLFKSLGLAVEDVATAQLVVHRARALGLGTHVDV